MSNSLFIYILVSKKYGKLHIGATNDLKRRVYEHKYDLLEGFIKEYQIHRLVYFEKIDAAYQALLREKRLKKWSRSLKIKLIEENNPDWENLYDRL